jgi:hypothetical protein
MKFTPKTEDQLREESLMPAGTYDFEVVEASNEKSKKGNDMIKVKLQLWDRNGDTRFLYDYLMEAMMFKLLHFCEATGLSQMFQAGNLSAENCLGRTGKVKIKVGEAQNGYAPKNEVKDYVSPQAGQGMAARAASAAPVASNAPADTDDVPF